MPETELFVVIVEVTLNASACRDHVKRLIVNNAETSIGCEPGCKQFDVVEFPDEPERFLLYETYRDRAAFEAHLESGHYRRFCLAADPHFEVKTVRLGRIAPPPKAPEDQP